QVFALILSEAEAVAGPLTVLFDEVEEVEPQQPTALSLTGHSVLGAWRTGMNGIHDMGGMHGFGPVVREKNEPVFHHEWEGRVYAMQRVTRVPIPGGSRNNIEQMDPLAYLTSSYYEKWLHSRIKGLIDAGALTEEELEARVAFYRDHPETPVPRRED